MLKATTGLPSCDRDSAHPLQENSTGSSSLKQKKRGSIVLLKLAATDIDSMNMNAVPRLLNAEAP